ncbi:MAG TPA: hypothetical protein VIV40_25325 [Kofleriaceae bacterium]
MGRSWAAIACIALVGCTTTTWKTVEPTSIPEHTDELFVIATDQAYVLDEARADGAVVRGQIISAWQVNPTANYLVRDGQSPQYVANKYAWSRQQGAASAELQILQLRHSSRRVDHVSRAPLIVGVVLLGLVGLTAIGVATIP